MNSTRQQLPTLPWKLLAVGLLFALSLALSPQTASADMNADEREVLRLVNEERARHGLNALVATRTLDAAAEWMAADMSTYDGIGHTDTLGRGPGGRAEAFGYQGGICCWENVAAGGIYASPAQVFQGWMDSPGHRANILEPQLKSIGIGLHYAPNTGYKHFWVQIFGGVIDSKPPVGAGGTPAPPTPPPPPLQPTAPPAAISGPIAPQGVSLVTVEKTATPESLIASALGSGCTHPSVWITEAGKLIGYIGGAPTFVNAKFPAQIANSSPVLFACT